MKAALVTGAAKGLGRSIACGLCQEGYQVWGQFHTSEQQAKDLENYCQQNNWHFTPIYGDFTTPETTKTFAVELKKKLCRLDMLVNNVGNFLDNRPHQTSFDQLYEMMQNNFFAPYILFEHLKNLLFAQPASVVNIGYCGLGSISAISYAAAYTYAKQALLAWTRSIAKEYISQGLRANMISPGHLENTVVSVPKGTKILEQRKGKLQEITDLLLYLQSPKGTYLTGQNIEVAGGVGL